MTHAESHAVGIIGAGTMGAGIAQVAAMHGWNVKLMDVDAATVQTAIDGIIKRLDRMVEKERVTAGERDDAAARLHVATAPDDFSAVELIIEAIVEDIARKTAVLSKLIPSLSDDAIIATNTSSLSVTQIGEAISQPARTVGMHFFNPAPLMMLVEVIAGAKTRSEVIDRVVHIAESWGKHVARAADVPGFIVNHVARPYYLEAFRILEDGYALPRDIDIAMTSIAGFRMGPLELTDLIGQDVNTATTRSVWEQLGNPPLLHPSSLQESLVSNGSLGRKTGRGVYSYDAQPPAPAIEIDRKPLPLNADEDQAMLAFTDAAVETAGTELQRYIIARILIAIFVQASLAYERGVAQRADIDTALQFGVNYPKGPFAWMDEIGHGCVAVMLEAFNAHVEDNRFAVPESLAAIVEAS